MAACVERAWQRFAACSTSWSASCRCCAPTLVGCAARVAPHGAVARRMVAACRGHARGGRFITAMAAVAGSVAEELIARSTTPASAAPTSTTAATSRCTSRPARASTSASSPTRRAALAGLPLDGRFAIDAATAVRGVATSGWRGRSFSLGIADAVTVLAASASAADAAATVIGNAVDVDDARHRARPGDALRDDSDLGDRLVTCAVPPLPTRQRRRGARRGAAAARAEIARGRIIAAVLSLQGRYRVVDDDALTRSRHRRRARSSSRSLVPC